MKEKQYTKKGLIKEIKKSIQETEEAIEATLSIKEFLSDSVSQEFINELDKSIEHNKNFIEYCKKCIEITLSGKLDHKLKP